MIESPISEVPPLGSAADNRAAIISEIIVDRHRVVGEVRWGGGPRRFVDIINGIEGAFAFIYDAELDDPFGGEGRSQHLAVMQVLKEAILFAVPRAGQEQHSSPFESVAKVPTPAVIILPGFEIRGNVYQVPGADPSRVPQVGSRQFIPVTDAVIVCTYGCATTWREPLVAVNMAQAMIYAPGVKPA